MFVTRDLGSPSDRLARELVAIRRSVKANQEQLAVASGVSRNTIGAIEQGASTPKASTLLKIALGAARIGYGDSREASNRSGEFYDRLLVAASYYHGTVVRTAGDDLNDPPTKADPAEPALAVQWAQMMAMVGSEILGSVARRLAELQDKLGRSGAFTAYPDIPSVLSNSIVALTDLRLSLEVVRADLERNRAQLSKVTAGDEELVAGKLRDQYEMLLTLLQHRIRADDVRTSESPESKHGGSTAMEERSEPIYRGWRDADGGRWPDAPHAVVVVRGDETKPLTNPRAESIGGGEYAWGQKGSAALALAQAILTDYLDEYPHEGLLKPFRDAHIASLDPQRSWEIGGTLIRSFLTGFEDLIWVPAYENEPPSEALRRDADVKRRILGDEHEPVSQPWPDALSLTMEEGVEDFLVDMGMEHLSPKRRGATTSTDQPEVQASKPEFTSDQPRRRGRQPKQVSEQ